METRTEMSASNTDRVLAFPFFLALLSIALMGVQQGHTDRAAVVVVVWVFLLVTSMKFNNTGHWAQFKWFGDRIIYYVDEGWFFCPWWLGFTYLPEDCRDQNFKLDNVKVFTSDDAEICFNEISIMWRIVELNLFHNLEPGGLKRLIDDIVDLNIKRRVNQLGVREAVKVQFSTEHVQTTTDLGRWGLEVEMVMVPSAPRPTDPKVMAALQLEVAELLETEGDAVKIQNILKRVAELVASGNYTKEQAIEQVQITTGEADKDINVQRILLDSSAQATLGALIAKFSGKE